MPLFGTAAHGHGDMAQGRIPHFFQLCIAVVDVTVNNNAIHGLIINHSLTMRNNSATSFCPPVLWYTFRMKIQEILSEFKRQNNATNLYIAEKIGVTPSTVSRWCRGQIKHIAPATMERLSDLLGTDVRALTQAIDFQLEKPVLGTVKAGYGLLAEENLDGYMSVSQEDFDRGDYFLRVTGDSMNGAHILDGDLLYVKSCNDVPSGAIAIILIGGEEATVKKLIKKKGYWILQAANPDVEPMVFTEKEIGELPVQIIGRALYARTDL